jgi:hypothetical protein
MTASGGVQLKDHTGDDSTTHDETNHSAAGKKKDEVVEGEEHAEEAEEESGGEEDNGDAQDEVATADLIDWTLLVTQTLFFFFRFLLQLFRTRTRICRRMN